MSEITISTGHPDAGRIYAEALDRVTAERDAAPGREAKLIVNSERGKRKYQKQLQRLQVAVGQRNSYKGQVIDLQHRLTAADERTDQQSWALLEVEAACDLAMSAMDDDERGANFVKIIAAIKAKAALKPAEGGGDEPR